MSKPSTTDATPTLEVLQAVLGEERPSFSRLLRLVTSLRERSDADGSAQIDQLLAGTIASLRRGVQEIGVEMDALRSSLEKMMSPPYFPASFHRVVQALDDTLAEVVQSGTSRLVHFAEDLKPEGLEPGDTLYLSSQLNVALARASQAAPRVGDVATFERRTDDGRMIIRDRDAEVLVTPTALLRDLELKSGDRIVYDPDARMALDRLDSADDTGRLLEEMGDVPPEKLAGHDAIKSRTLRRFVQSTLNPELAALYGIEEAGRLLLTGPPGCGKTTLMKVTAHQFGLATGKKPRIVTVNGAELFSPWVGQTEQNIKGVFDVLSGHDGPAVLFIDEIDAIGRVRGGLGGWHDDRFLGTLLSNLEGMRGDADVIVIAATNRADVLDPALRSRFAWEVEMARPRMDAARAIFSVHLDEDLPYRPNGADAPSTRQSLIDCAVSRLYAPNAGNEVACLRFRDSTARSVSASELVSGRFIKQVCDAARRAAFDRHASGGEEGLTLADMEHAVDEGIARLRVLLSPQNAKAYVTDLPQEVDVVAVEPTHSQVSTHRYLQ